MFHKISAKKYKKGFTLLELVITMAVVVIMASIAIPTTFVLVKQKNQQHAKLVMDSIYKEIDGSIKENKGMSDNDLKNDEINEYFNFSSIDKLESITIQTVPNVVESVESRKIKVKVEMKYGIHDEREIFCPYFKYPKIDKIVIKVRENEKKLYVS